MGNSTGVSKGLLSRKFLRKYLVSDSRLFLKTKERKLRNIVINSSVINAKTTLNRFRTLYLRDGPLEKFRGVEFSSRGNFFRDQIPCMNFFRP